MSTEQQKSTDTNIGFWNNIWNDMKISFHINDLHPMLLKHLETLLEGKSNQRFFFPLCGKALDMRWLASLGHQVIGIELSQKAIEQFFEEGNMKFIVEEKDDLKVFISEDKNIKLYCGDFFNLTSKHEEPVDCVWDRGSLVAIPVDIRKKYVNHILSLLAPNFRYLLDTFEYNKALHPGPPHSMSIEDVKELYGSRCSVSLIDSHLEDNIPFARENLKDEPPYENLYLLKPA